MNLITKLDTLLEKYEYKNYKLPKYIYMSYFTRKQMLNDWGVHQVDYPGGIRISITSNNTDMWYRSIPVHIDQFIGDCEFRLRDTKIEERRDVSTDVKQLLDQMLANYKKKTGEKPDRIYMSEATRQELGSEEAFDKDENDPGITTMFKYSDGEYYVTYQGIRVYGHKTMAYGTIVLKNNEIED